MANYSLDNAAVQRLLGEPTVQEAVRGLSDSILAESRNNVVQMGAVETGALRDSGFVDQDHTTGEARIGYTVDYASIVHEGDGTSKSYGPRPFLADAALKKRGTIA